MRRWTVSWQEEEPGWPAGPGTSTQLCLPAHFSGDQLIKEKDKKGTWRKHNYQIRPPHFGSFKFDFIFIVFLCNNQGFVFDFTRIVAAGSAGKETKYNL